VRTLGHAGRVPLGGRWVYLERVRWPSGFEPVRGFGEWVGFIGGILVASAIVALVAWNAVRLAEGDLSLADFNQPDSFAIRFQNDLDTPVFLALCHSDHSASCQNPYYRDRIAPGAAIEENISPDTRTEWAVEDRYARPLRCVLLYWKHYPGADQSVQLSGAPRWSSPCSDTTPAVPITQR
jgi:hypothetical protein